MAIWFESISIQSLNQRGKNTLAEFLNIDFIEVAENTLSAIMPVQAKILQPMGIVHGGANVVLAETVASTAANACVDNSIEYCVGLEINANHIKPVRSGNILAVAKPIHLGKSTQVWAIDLFDDEKYLTCTSRMTAAVLKRKK